MSHNYVNKLTTLEPKDYVYKNIFEFKEKHKIKMILLKKFGKKILILLKVNVLIVIFILFVNLLVVVNKEFMVDLSHIH